MGPLLGVDRTACGLVLALFVVYDCNAPGDGAKSIPRFSSNCAFS